MSSPLDGNGVAAAEAAFNASINNPQMVPCSKCEGRGFHHGFGEDGNDPDWCTECGGNQFNVVPGEETRAIEAAIAAYLASVAPSQTAVEPVADALEWRCSGCGALSPGKVRACACPTDCLHVHGDPKASAIKIDAAMDDFMAWVHRGPTLARAAGVYVGIKIYASEQAARAAGDIA